ncbi:MAG: hypothetical protein GY757_07660, partial [bacterium]|nr:hypothetical protein [bacterium]
MKKLEYALIIPKVDNREKGTYSELAASKVGPKNMEKYFPKGALVEPDTQAHLLELRNPVKNLYYGGDQYGSTPYGYMPRRGPEEDYRIGLKGQGHYYGAGSQFPPSIPETANRFSRLTLNDPGTSYKPKLVP